MPMPMRDEREEPVLQDHALRELSQMFLSHPSDATPGSEALDVSRFDFSLESLGAMDEHLETDANEAVVGSRVEQLHPSQRCVPRNHFKTSRVHPAVVG
jgi:hypothetical protein